MAVNINILEESDIAELRAAIGNISDGTTAGMQLLESKLDIIINKLQGGTVPDEPDDPPPATGLVWGVNLSGLDFGDHILSSHGKLGTNYWQPNQREVDYFTGKHMPLLRVGLRWERLQHEPYGSIDDYDMGLLKNVISMAASKGALVIPEPHNFGRYRNFAQGTTYVVGSGNFPDSTLADFWKKMAAQLKDIPGLYGYDIMNEPHDMPNGNNGWKNTCQAVINAIREEDMDHPILIPGNHWSNASRWKIDSYMLSQLVDPAKKLKFTAHEYLDADQTGTYKGDPDAVPNNIGITRYTPFIEWLRQTGNKGIVGEIGVNRNSEWMAKFDIALGFLKGCADVLEGVLIWAAGPAWGDYTLSIEPGKDGSDKPQMAIIDKYTG